MARGLTPHLKAAVCRLALQRGDMNTTELMTGKSVVVAGRPIAPHLFTSTGPRARLIGSRCLHCGEVAFPQRESCSACSGTKLQRHLLARRGRLWTWTVQGFRPKPPFGLPPDEDFEPFGVGYIELPGETRVEARLTVADAQHLRIGMLMELTFIRLWDEDGAQLVTFAFQPCVEEEQG